MSMNMITRKYEVVFLCSIHKHFQYSANYSLCKSIRLEFSVNIFGYIYDITIPTKNLSLGINYLMQISCQIGSTMCVLFKIFKKNSDLIDLHRL